MSRAETSAPNENAGKLMGLSVATLVSALAAVTRARVWLNERRIQKAHDVIISLSEGNPMSAADRAFPIQRTDNRFNRTRN